MKVFTHNACTHMNPNKQPPMDWSDLHISATNMFFDIETEKYFSEMMEIDA